MYLEAPLPYEQAHAEMMSIWETQGLKQEHGGTALA